MKDKSRKTTPPGKLRLGVVGAGGIADRRTLPVIGQVPNCELVIVMDTREPERLGRKYGLDWADTLHGVLDRPDVDAVYIASPVHVHADQVIAAAAAGKHVLCEKPLARDLAEAEAMVTACCNAGVLLREAYMLRHHGAHLAIKRKIAAGAIGTPVYASVQWAFLYPKTENAWRQRPELGGGGALADVGCHAFDLLHMLIGRIKRVAALTGALVQDYAVEDLATVLVQFENGAQGTVTTSFCLSSGCMPPMLSIYGSEGRITANTLSQGSGGTATLYTERDGQSHPIEYEEINTYAQQMEVFASDVLTGTITSADCREELLRSMRVLSASYESAKTCAWVSIGKQH